MKLFRRFLLLQLLMLWQGGFLFYALVVVPIGADVLGSEVDQGFITRRVTFWLNAIGALCLCVYVLDTKCVAKHQPLRKSIAAISILLLLSLFALRQFLDSFLDPNNHTIENHHAFYRWHGLYLIISGVQWFLMLAAAWLMLAAWRAADVECLHTKPETP
jgi:hypothetical protein